MDWMTVAQTVWPHEAHMIAGLLRENGIDVVVADENIVQMQGFASHAVGGVKVRVRVVDAERARLIIDDMHNDSFDEEETE
jgi:hypothetical protein